jgi:predicted ATP-dependent serine protease
MITVRCKECGKEISTNTGKTISCGCPNMATLNGDRLTAVDLNKVVMVRSHEEERSQGLTSQDLQWQEERRKRKVRKLDFEIR